MPRIKTKKIEAEVDELLLDSENPRIGSVRGQAEALEAIIKLSTKHFRNMMDSISENGIDPGDSLYVIVDEKDKGSYVVIDGNRRVASLKILDNPDLLDGTGLGASVKARIRESALDFESVSPISCVVFKTRADAHEWIERRHGKGMEGEGRIPWGTLESERFQNDRTILDVIDFVKRNTSHDDAEWQKIEKGINKNPTTLRRLIVSKAGRQALGFIPTHENGGPGFKRDPKFVMEVLSHLFEDISSGEVNSRNYNTASEIGEYFKEFESSGKTKKTASNAYSFATTEIHGKKDSSKPIKISSTTNSSKVKRVSQIRRTLAPSEHPFKEPLEDKGKQLFREASRVKLSEVPLSAAFLLRAILEFATETEMRASGISDTRSNGKELDLKGRFNAVATHLQSTSGRLEGKDDLKSIKNTLNASSGSVSISALNGYIHNRYQKPSPDDLRNAWDHAVPLFVAIFGKN